MPVLLLAQGDPAAKDMLRRAIEARYGLRPPAIESLQVDFKGRARARLGPLSTWVPVEATARFLFPTAIRWDFMVRPAGVEIQRGVEAFDGTHYRRTRGGHSPSVIDDPEQISSIQSRLWAIAALLLTPLGEQYVTLAVCDDSRLSATNTLFNNAVELGMRENRTLDYVTAVCLNPDNDRQERFTLRLSEDQSSINDLMLPCKVFAFWNDEPYFEVEPVRAESNPPFENGIFTLS
ncbi:MAG: hypothetical protein BroJett038_04680 [Chloroflexota bacterium]|nr:MAG: hypothetical protein BroJett038_04680 [Chloroflexota bacterium]